MVSSNVCAARMIKEVGIRSVIQVARVLGIETPLEYDYTIALGSNGVKLFEFTRAYGAFANGGYKVEPYAVESIETSRGKVIYTAPKAKSTKVLAIETAATMTASLQKEPRVLRLRPRAKLRVRAARPRLRQMVTVQH